VKNLTARRLSIADPGTEHLETNSARTVDTCERGWDLFGVRRFKSSA
jgi:hypothetical protein